ncbi:DUF368 domain-containing protein [Truepera radiovictrix]|uniref:DUF368 domain-containing protein n=1 Tax=Truepera radiovictrix (strain DSM 17093 / CIP 108686 / LMG 22925 / RQ-24) TaxID=649638 RepID=D7CW46_TRURR|nr:DUF368 domain-containing protein [Truepera radiovictrix]ADI14309.1 protein of unknown function DUF368 [Truepera radiovictrix DSM 17093]WMT57135.1 DUF368 domain-containing protein [Truepera radiovictrix]
MRDVDASYSQPARHPLPAATDAAPERTPKDYGALVLKGFAMGSCDIVPGVSGGTMALILGIYEELIGSIRGLARPPFWRALVRGRLLEAFRVGNLSFLLAVGGGIVLAVLTLARVLEHFLAQQPVLVWSFFFGLIAASVLTVGARVARWTPATLAAFAFGALFAFVLVGLRPTQTPETAWFLFLSGAIAVCALILPGISGAFILVLLGKYQYILAALNRGDVATLLTLMSGMVVGILLFTQVLGWMFRRFHDLTVALLCGFMLGALRSVWPWKAASEAGALGVNVWPTVNAELFVALGLMALGFALVYTFDHPRRAAPRP